jgi:hypothetical protein
MGLIEEIFPLLEEALSFGMKRRLGEDFSLFDCWKMEGGIYADYTLLKLDKVGVYAFCESNGENFGYAAELYVPQCPNPEKVNKEDLDRLEQMFFEKYGK